jgi:hypothetical protein
MEVAHEKSVDSRPVHNPKSKGRSRISNGNELLPDIDGRSVIARRYKDITRAILIDQGGADRCSESRLQLIRRFAAAACLAEQLESRLANGEEIDIAEHASLSSTLVRLAARIGIDRVPKDVTELSFTQYLTESAPAEDLSNEDQGIETAEDKTPTGKRRKGRKRHRSAARHVDDQPEACEAVFDHDEDEDEAPA